ncbi:hypothetical protein GQ600_25035 [Phytophthora cactorum]|nr:hypothetical protein GQ600_25035 [Phytophthora cactorum]
MSSTAVEFGLINTFRTHNVLVDTLLCMLVPLLIQKIVAYVQQSPQSILAMLRNFLFPMKDERRVSRVIEVKQRFNRWKNHLLQKAISIYLADVLDLKKKNAQYELLEKTKKNKKTTKALLDAAVSESDCSTTGSESSDGDDDDDQYCGEVNRLNVEALPPLNEWIQIDPGVYFKHETVAPGNTGEKKVTVKESTVNYRFESSLPDASKRIDAIIDRAFKNYQATERRKHVEDKSRYFYPPTKTEDAAAATTDKPAQSEDDKLVSSMIKASFEISSQAFTPAEIEELCAEHDDVDAVLGGFERLAASAKNAGHSSSFHTRLASHQRKIQAKVNQLDVPLSGSLRCIRASSSTLDSPLQALEASPLFHSATIRRSLARMAEYERFLLSRSRTRPTALLHACFKLLDGESEDDEAEAEEKQRVESRAIDHDGCLRHQKLVGGGRGARSRNVVHSSAPCLRVDVQAWPKMLDYHLMSTTPSLLWMPGRASGRFQRYPHVETNFLDLSANGSLFAGFLEEEREKEITAFVRLLSPTVPVDLGDNTFSGLELIPVLAFLAFIAFVVNENREFVLGVVRTRLFAWYYFGRMHGFVFVYPSSRRQFVLEGLVNGTWSFWLSLGAMVCRT